VQKEVFDLLICGVRAPSWHHCSSKTNDGAAWIQGGNHSDADWTTAKTASPAEMLVAGMSEVLQRAS
jgi:hypothetical protein